MYMFSINKIIPRYISIFSGYIIIYIYIYILTIDVNIQQ